MFHLEPICKINTWIYQVYYFDYFLDQSGLGWSAELKKKNDQGYKINLPRSSMDLFGGTNKGCRSWKSVWRLACNLQTATASGGLQLLLSKQPTTASRAEAVYELKVRTH